MSAASSVMLAGQGMASELRRRLWAALCRSRFYRLTLAGTTPSGLAVALPIRWPGDATLGSQLLAGEFVLAGESVRQPAPLGDPEGPSEAWLAEFHGFSWLADLAALAGAASREAGRGAIAAWLEANRDWRPLAWRADVLATRIVAWITLFDVFFARPDGDDALRDAVLASLARQLRHLGRVAPLEGTGAARLVALKGLVFGALALGLGERRVGRILAQLSRELAHQVHPDGCHLERSPLAQFAVLRDLVDIRTALRAAHVVVPDALQMAIDRMVPMLRMLRHGDGRFAHFNGGSEALGPLADLVLTRSEVRGKPLLAAPYGGFQRLQGGKTVVLVDTGAPPAAGLDADAHAGTLSFEMSCGRERLIVNCGAPRGANPAWRRAARSTAAHSTVVVADTNSSQLLDDGTIGHRAAVSGVERAEDEGSQWVVATHNGYGEKFAILHTRQLFLAADGDDLRGEDTLTGPAGEGFAVRFHLHPSVQVSLSQDGAAALLRLPSGTGFRLRAQGAQMSLAESVYLGNGEVRRTQQIVLAGHVGTQGATVQWAIRREGRKAEG